MLACSGIPDPILKSTLAQTERLFGGFGLRVAYGDPAAICGELLKVSALGGGGEAG